jgi:hypothetical protein
MAGILSTLASFETPDSTLTLLNLNNVKLALMFKPCIAELLTHLLRDASRNIALGFTNNWITNTYAWRHLQTSPTPDGPIRAGYHGPAPRKPVLFRL